MHSAPGRRAARITNTESCRQDLTGDVTREAVAGERDERADVASRHPHGVVRAELVMGADDRLGIDHGVAVGVVEDDPAVVPVATGA